jgi:hypothetical protein
VTTSGFFIPLQSKYDAIFPKIIGHGPLPVTVIKSPVYMYMGSFEIVKHVSINASSFTLEASQLYATTTQSTKAFASNYMGHVAGKGTFGQLTSILK